MRCLECPCCVLNRVAYSHAHRTKFPYGVSHSIGCAACSTVVDERGVDKVFFFCPENNPQAYGVPWHYTLEYNM